MALRAAPSSVAARLDSLPFQLESGVLGAANGAIMLGRRRLVFDASRCLDFGDFLTTRGDGAMTVAVGLLLGRGSFRGDGLGLDLWFVGLGTDLLVSLVFLL